MRHFELYHLYLAPELANEVCEIVLDFFLFKAGLFLCCLLAFIYIKAMNAVDKLGESNQISDLSKFLAAYYSILRPLLHCLNFDRNKYCINFHAL
jgi:hypothetical protein